MKRTNRFICGDALAELRKLTPGSIDMCLTSPPYWSLRDYGIEQIFGGDLVCKHRWSSSQIEHDNLRYRGHNANVGSNKNPEIHKGKEKSGGQNCIFCGAWKGQLGLEATPEMYIEHLTEIFNEVKRVLKKAGTLWLNIGDTYSGSGRAGSKEYAERHTEFGKPFNMGRYQAPSPKIDNIQPKCLCMIPERLAWSLIQDGWTLRNKIIWYKPNAMPSSVTDRFSNRWEYIFMLSKSQRYYFDLDAVREPHKEMSLERWGEGGEDIFDTKYSKKCPATSVGNLRNASNPLNSAGKNPGDVFEINTQPFSEAHFAVFPEKLCEKPIKATCPGEICKKCGKARERIVEKYDTGKTQKMPDNWEIDLGSHGAIHRKGRIKGETGIPVMANKTIGWTSCKCNAGFEPGIVLDPFAGAGTAGVVAKRLGRRFILIDMKKEYIEMAKRRVARVGYQKELFEE